MSTIETEMIDRYVLGVMKNEDIPVAERAYSAAAAIAVFVMTEEGLPMTEPLHAEPDDIAFLESALHDKFADHCDDLADAVDDAYDALGLNIVQGIVDLVTQIEAMDEAEAKTEQAKAAGLAKGGPIDSVKSSTMRLVDEHFHNSMLDQTIVNYFDQKREDIR